MNRREALRNVAFLLGGTVISSQTFLTSCVFDSQNEGENGLFSQGDIALMDEIGEIIIPTTDTPGAKAAEVGKFMAVMMRDCYEKQQQETFSNGLLTIRQDFGDRYGTSFIEATPEDRVSFISILEEETKEYYRTKKQEDPPHYYLMLKELTLLGYFTSEIGSTQALKYIQTPGRYEACIPYEKGGRAWAEA